MGKPTGYGRLLFMAGQNKFDQKSRLFWPPGQGRGRDADLTPTNARKGHFRPKKQHPTLNLPKHLRSRMFSGKSP
jgi:hypothetical protein